MTRESMKHRREKKKMLIEDKVQIEAVKTKSYMMGEIDGKVMIAQRNYGSSKGFFEFPGGKVEKSETKEEALIREWKEECDIDIHNVQYLASSVDYQNGYEIHLTCFTCTSNEKPTKLSVHSEYIWTTPDHIYDYNFFKSDKMLVEALKGGWPCLTKPMKPKY